MAKSKRCTIEPDGYLNINGKLFRLFRGVAWNKIEYKTDQDLVDIVKMYKGKKIIVTEDHVFYEHV